MPAGLAGIEECRPVLDGMLEVGIGPYVRGIVAPELEPSAGETPGGRALNRVPALDRARERNEVDARVADHALGVGMREVQDLEESGGQPGLRETGGELFGAQRRLRGMLEDHSVARHERGHDAVHGDQVRIVPGGDREHHAQRLAADEAREPGLRPHVDVVQGAGGGVDHEARAFQRAAHLAG
jgi:hypothetical protein